MSNEINNMELWGLSKLAQRDHFLKHVLSAQSLAKLTQLGLVTYTRDGAGRYNISITPAGREYFEAHKHTLDRR